MLQFYTVEERSFYFITLKCGGYLSRILCVPIIGGKIDRKYVFFADILIFLPYNFEYEFLSFFFVANTCNSE